MFDVSFVELLLIGVVALVVLGPEKLPTAARTAGRFIRRARSSWHGVRAEFEREFAAEELKRSMREAAANVDVSADLRKAADEIRKEVEDPLLGRATPAENAATSDLLDASIEGAPRAVASTETLPSAAADPAADSAVEAGVEPGDSMHESDYKPHG